MSKIGVFITVLVSKLCEKKKKTGKNKKKNSQSADQNEFKFCWGCKTCPNQGDTETLQNIERRQNTELLMLWTISAWVSSMILGKNSIRILVRCQESSKWVKGIINGAGILGPSSRKRISQRIFTPQRGKEPCFGVPERLVGGFHVWWKISITRESQGRSKICSLDHWHRLGWRNWEAKFTTPKW